MKGFYSRGILVGLFLLLFALAGCPATKVVFPPISNNAAKISTPGKFVWFDLLSTDMTACENFYEALFGWNFQRTNDSNARVKTIFHQSTPIGNMIGRESSPGDSQWLSYMSSEDVDATLHLADANGGSTYREARDMPNRGRTGLALDPQGAAFAVLTSPSGDPIDVGFRPDMWMGAELWTTNVKGAAKFYQEIAGYDIEHVEVHEKVEYWMLKKNGKPRAGIVSIPWKGMKPEWVPYIAVASVTAVVEKVEALGGTILIAPDMSVKEGRLAMISDPSGAVFGIHQIR